jgi:hypothetical protein
MSCGRVALERAGVPCTTYCASEIDKYAETVSKRNWPDIVRLGSVCDWPLWHEFKHVQDIDMLMAGSPCQGFSFAGKQLAFDDPRSRLYFDFVNCIREFKPRWVLLENVRMKPQFQGVITRTMQEALDSYGGGKLHKIEINSALVCAQNRRRIYWTNWPVSQPEDRGILLRDILLQEHSDDLSSLEVDASKVEPQECTKAGGVVGVYGGKDAQATRVRDPHGKAQTLTGGGGGLGTKMGMYDLSSLEVDASRYEHLLTQEHGDCIDDYNQRVKQDGKSCTLTPNSGASAFRNGQKVVANAPDGPRIPQATPRRVRTFAGATRWLHGGRKQHATLPDARQRLASGHDRAHTTMQHTNNHGGTQ